MVMQNEGTEPIGILRKHRFPIFRAVSLIIAGALIVSSFFCFWKAKKLAAPFEELQAAQPIYMEVDVSKPVVYSCNINHSQYAKLVEHGADLLLVHKSDLTFPEIFKELEGKVEVFNNSGELINQFNLHNETHEAQTYRLGTENIKGCSPMWVIYPFTPECRELRLTITKPVEQLANVEQSLEGYYLLCGMEFMPSCVAGFSGLILLGTGLLIVIIVLIITYIKRRKQRLITHIEYTST